MKNPFWNMARLSRPARKKISGALSIQRVLLPLFAAVKKAKKRQKPSHATARRAPEKSAGTTRPLPGSFEDGKFVGAEGSLAYKLYSPKGSTRRKLPLVTMLHGCTQSAADFAAGTGMNTLADELGFLVLYPRQSTAANIGRCWNWHRPGDQRRGSGEPALIAALTRQIIKTCNADSSRVYIAGISAGGAAAAIIAAAYPELYVAVGVHSGLCRANIATMRGALAAMRSGPDMYAPVVRTKAPPLPTIVFHGDHDKVVHPANARGFLTVLDRSGPKPMLSVHERGSQGGREFVRTQYRKGGNAILLENWDIRGAGHAWSGGSRMGTYADSAGPDASREMMRFFLSRKRSVVERARGAVASAPIGA